MEKKRTIHFKTGQRKEISQDLANKIHKMIQDKPNLPNLWIFDGDNLALYLDFLQVAYID